MRTLFVVAKPLYPPSGGSALRNWQHIEAARTEGPVAAVAITGVRGTPGSKDAGDPPGLALSRQHYVPPGMPVLKRLRARVRRHGYPVAVRLHRRDLERDLATVIAEFRPDVAVFCEPWLFHYVPLLERAGVPVVLDCHNMEGPLRARLAGARRGVIQRLRFWLSVRQLYGIEHDFVRRAQAVWVCSTEDADLLAAEYGARDGVAVVPNAIAVETYAAVREGTVPPPAALSAAAPTFGMVASYGYEPNRQAARVLVETVLPALRRRDPRWRLVLAGRDPAPEMLAAAARDPGIVVSGLVDDVRPWLAAIPVIAAPLAVGGGTRLKLLEAFAAGRAVVTTRQGAEGLDVRDGEHVRFAEEPGAMADAVEALHHDAGARARQVAAALDLVRRRYSYEALATVTAALLREAAATRA